MGVGIVIGRWGSRNDNRTLGPTVVRVWKSKAVVTKSKLHTRINDKSKVLLRGAACGVTYYDDIDKFGRNTLFETLRVFPMLHDRARPCV
jgi:hypothetical protein